MLHYEIKLKHNLKRDPLQKMQKKTIISKYPFFMYTTQSPSNSLNKFCLYFKATFLMGKQSANLESGHELAAK
jgi:hypothetical protein